MSQIIVFVCLLIYLFIYLARVRRLFKRMGYRGAIKNVSSTSNSLMYLTTHSKHFNGQIWEWSTWSIAGALVVCLMRVPSETNLKNLTRSRLKGRNDGYFRPTNFKFHYVDPQFFIFRRTVQIAPNFRHWNAHIFLFWLNPTRHSKFHNTPKHRFRSDCSYSLVPVSAAGPPLPPLFFFPVPERGTGEGQYLYAWQACATTTCS